MLGAVRLAEEPEFSDRELLAKYGAFFKRQLRILKLRRCIIKEVRGEGLFIRVEFREGIAEKLSNKLSERGMFTGSIDNIVYIAAPVSVTQNNIVRIVEEFDAALAEC